MPSEGTKFSMLSLSASSPLREPQSNHSFHGQQHLSRTYSSADSGQSAGTVQHHRLRSLSPGSSLSSLSSLVVPAFRRHDDQGATSRSSSSHNLTLRRFPTGSDRRSASSSDFSRRASFASVLSSRRRSELIVANASEKARLLGVEENDGAVVEEGGDELSFVEEEERPSSVIHTVAFAPTMIETDIPPQDNALPESPKKSGPLRWLSTLRRRKQPKAVHTTPTTHRFALDDFEHKPAASPGKNGRHKKSESWSSSLRLVTAVRSATATIASMSIATVSRRKTKWRREQQRSSIMSGSEIRPSMESQRSVMDEAAKQRSRKRRNKLEELIRTEESYVADIKALSNAYCTLLGHQPSPASFARASAQKNIAGILHLHDDLLGQLHQIVPFAEYDQRTARPYPDTSLVRAHTRWHSVDAVPARGSPARTNLLSIRQGRRSLNLSRSSEQEQMMLRCSPQIILVVAKLFLDFMERMKLYQEYGANYELVQRDIEETQRTILSWPDFDRAIEALGAHVNPIRSREANQKKAMTVKDLLIKPIQRLPRYELLFNDLCTLTPVCDDPDANATIQELVVRLGETCHHVNQAKDNPVRTHMLEATWVLGDRLSFSNQVPKSVFLQLLGPVNLCGCLHIAYRGKSMIRGSYMICLLFSSTLLLAAVSDDQTRYLTLAGIPLANTTIVEADNGKGLQCYTAPHSWKIVFEHAARMYEIIVTACSAVEADVWRQHLSARVDLQTKAVTDGLTNIFELHSPLTAEMRSVGKAFGKPGSFVRRMSVHRTATVGPSTDLNQVIIKNTQAVKEAIDSHNASHSSLQIPRSQSVATPSHVQTLAPRRADRIRLEAALADVWTKDLLPYPGMQPRRSDPIRAGANHVIRKFSMASITSNFSSSKRSGSYASISQSSRSGGGKEDMPPPPLPASSHYSSKQKPKRRSPKRPPLVDFHNAPEAFLPADFELRDPSTKKKSAFRTFTLSMERPFSPLLGTDTKSSSGLRRAQSVRDVHEQQGVKDENAALRSAVTLPAEYGSGSPKGKEDARPVYSVVNEQRARTPAPGINEGSEDTMTAETFKTPKKSKSRGKLFRLFG